MTLHHWHENTLILLKERDPAIKLEDIASGTGLNFYWIKAFLKNKHNDPGVNKVGKLHDYLVARKEVNNAISNQNAEEHI